MLLHGPTFYQWEKCEKYSVFIFSQDQEFSRENLVVTKVEVPNRVLTCNMRNNFATVHVCVYQAVYKSATPTEFTVEFTFLPEINNVQPGMVPSS